VIKLPVEDEYEDDMACMLTGRDHSSREDAGYAALVLPI
jgi:hypothetical protein